MNQIDSLQQRMRRAVFPSQQNPDRCVGKPRANQIEEWRGDYDVADTVMPDQQDTWTRWQLENTRAGIRAPSAKQSQVGAPNQSLDIFSRTLQKSPLRS